MSDNIPNDGDFENWNPEHPSDGFFYMGPYNDKFKDMWNDWTKMQKNNQSNYMSFDDIMKMFGEANAQNKRDPNQKNRRPKPNPNVKITRTVITPEDYQRLLEIRGYLNITEQYAYVKTLDKILNNMNPFITDFPGNK